MVLCTLFHLTCRYGTLHTETYLWCCAHCFAGRCITHCPSWHFVWCFVHCSTWHIDMVFETLFCPTIRYGVLCTILAGTYGVVQTVPPRHLDMVFCTLFHLAMVFYTLSWPTIWYGVLHTILAETYLWCCAHWLCSAWHLGMCFVHCPIQQFGTVSCTLYSETYFWCCVPCSAWDLHMEFCTLS